MTSKHRATVVLLKERSAAFQQVSAPVLCNKVCAHSKKKRRRFRYDAIIQAMKLNETKNKLEVKRKMVDAGNDRF